jgi:hypothetical protein
MNPEVKLPEDNLFKIKRAKKLLVIIKDDLDRVHSFSQKFYETTNKTFLTFCK